MLAEGEGVRSTSIATEGCPVRVGILDTERLIKDYELIPPHLKAC